MRTSFARTVVAIAAVVALVVPASLLAADPAGTLRQLTTGNLSWNGRWSPNGQWIAYQKDPGVSYHYGIIYKIKVDGTMDTQVTQLTDDWYCDSKPAWSPDGKWIAFTRNERPAEVWTAAGHVTSIWKVRANGTGETRVAKYEELEFDGDPTDNDGSGSMAPAWSPDGQWIAFKRGYGGMDKFHSGVFVVRPDGTGLKRVSQSYFGHSPQMDDIQWKPAGTGVGTTLMASLINPVYYNSASYYRGVALLNRARPAANKWVTNGFGYTCQQQNEWSPNGRKVAYKDDSLGQGDIWTMTATGRGKVRLTESSYVDYVEGIDPCYNNPTWSPNNKYIAYYQEDDNGKWVGVMTANGKHKLLLARIDSDSYGVGTGEYLLSFNPQGTKILCECDLGADDGHDQLCVIDLDTADDDGDGKKNWEEILLAN